MLKYIFSLLIIFGSLTMMAQDTLSYYINKDGENTTKENANGLRKVMKTEEGLYLVKDYYLEGEIKRVGTYLTDSLKLKERVDTFKVFFKSGNLKSISNYNKGKIHGAHSTYYKTGQLKSSIDYAYDIKHGQLITYWDNGTIKREEKYINGNFVNGKCFNNIGEEIEFFPYEVYPEFEGGLNGVYSYLSKNVSYPTEAKKNNISGKVFVNFQVNKIGEIEQVKIVKSVHPLLDNEAIRVVKMMPKWLPGKIDGEEVPMILNLPINFRIDNSSNVKSRSFIDYEKGNKYMNSSNFKKAIYFFSESIKWEENNVNAYYNRGLCYAKLGDYENACKDWNKCVELGDIEVKKNIKEFCK